MFTQNKKQRAFSSRSYQENEAEPCRLAASRSLKPLGCQLRSRALNPFGFEPLVEVDPERFLLAVPSEPYGVVGAIWHLRNLVIPHLLPGCCGKLLTEQVDLKKEKLVPAKLAALLLGPSGNLRAPTIRAGKTLVVGFSAEAYGELFG